jgi:hypothetical protein
MTRKDYIAIAAAIKEARSHGAETVAATEFNLGVTTATQRVADVLARDNPRFDRARFLTACGVK